MIMHNTCKFMPEAIPGPLSVSTDAQQIVRRNAIVRILREGLVRKQTDLVRLL